MGKASAIVNPPTDLFQALELQGKMNGIELDEIYEILRDKTSLLAAIENLEQISKSSSSLDFHSNSIGADIPDIDCKLAAVEPHLRELIAKSTEDSEELENLVHIYESMVIIAFTVIYTGHLYFLSLGCLLSLPIMLIFP